MAEESIQEQTTTKNKKDFSKAVSKVGKSLGNFIKSLYGKKIDTEQGEPPRSKTSDANDRPTSDTNDRLTSSPKRFS